VPLVIAGVAVAGVLWGFFSSGDDPVVAFAKHLADGLATMADGAISLLPAASDLHLSAQTGWLWGYSYMNRIVPIPEVLAFVAILAGVRVGIFTWRLAVNIWHLIPKPLAGT
jgi:hypothetical protein